MFKFFRKKNIHDDTPEVIKEVKIKAKDIFADIDSTTIEIKYKGVILSYKDLEKSFFDFYTPELPKLFGNFYSNTKKIKSIVKKLNFENKNLTYDFIFTIEGLENIDFKQFFKDWVKQTEHPKIKKFAWFLAEKGFLEKKKLKNRVYYKYKKDIDYHLLFKEAITAEKQKYLVYLDSLLFALSGKGSNYIKIDKAYDEKFKAFYSKTYYKWEAPLILTLYINSYDAKNPKTYKENEFPSIKDWLNNAIVIKDVK